MKKQTNQLKIVKKIPDIPDYCLWVLACEYYINESRDDDDDEEEEKNKQEAFEAFNKAQEEFINTKYENIKVV